MAAACLNAVRKIAGFQTYTIRIFQDLLKITISEFVDKVPINNVLVLYETSRLLTHPIYTKKGHVMEQATISWERDCIYNEFRRGRMA
jgi:hypothetical protein